MVKHLEASSVLRRWLAIAVALLLSAGIWSVSAHQASAATTNVRMTNFTFTPPDITITVGDTVTWINDDTESHAPEGGSFSSPEVRSGETWSHTFTAPEEISYICRFHTYITGTISVVPAGAPATTAPPPTAAPTTAPPTTAATSPDDTATTSTTVAPVVRAPSGTRGAAFQDVPDDPSARKPPAEAGPSKVSTVDPTTSPTPSTAPATSTPGTGPSSGGTSGGSTQHSGGSSFQEVPSDPGAVHAPGQFVSARSTDEGDPPDDSSPPSATTAGKPLGDGHFLAPSIRDGNVKVFHLTMAETTIETAPGVVKQAYAFNGIIPGPVLRVDEGDRVRIIVDNQLPFPTSTHWHGMILPNDQDGVGGITQAHIEPGGQYVYEWTAVATGTHWYHAHSSGRHIGKGLFGMLEVVPKKGDFEADHDYRLMIGDTDLGFTLNGRSFPLTPTLETAVGETVRLRLVNTGDQVHAMHLHGIPFKVVAQDGIPSEQPEQMDTLTIAPGQTFDLLFSEPYPGKWVLHCHMFVHSHMTDDVHPPGESGMNGITAIVNVTGSPDPDDVSDVADSPEEIGKLLSTSFDGRSDSSVVSLLGIIALLAAAGATGATRKRIRPHLPTQKTQKS